MTDKVTEAIVVPSSKKTVRKRQSRSEYRRRLILKVTTGLLNTTPVNELSLYQVAEQAGIPPSSVYHFFPKVEVLLSSLLEDIFVKFDAILDEPLETDTIHHWKDIFLQLQSRCINYYRQHRYVRSLILGQHIMVNIHHADYEHDHLMGRKIYQHYQQFFHLPVLPVEYDIFAIALQIADKVYSLSHQKHDNITDQMAEEGCRAALAYLGIYLPEQMIERL